MWVMFLTLYVTSGIIPVLIFKNQRSASSWLTATLNKFEGIFITDEIIDGSAFHRGNVWEESQAWVMESFSKPKRIYRYFWDERTKKPDGDFSVLGSTLNPYFGNQFINFLAIGKKLPNLKLVLYRRSNIVKHALSIMRGEVWNAKCGKLVLNKDCKIDGKYRVKIPLLKNTLKRLLVFDEALFQHANRLAKRLDNWFHYVTYEDLQKEDGVAWERLFEFIGYVPNEISLKEAVGRCSGNCTTTSDDLREVIINHKEVESFISENYPCLESYFHEARPDQALPEIGLTCPTLFAPGRRDFNARMQDFFTKNRKKWLLCCSAENYNCTCSWEQN